MGVERYELSSIELSVAEKLGNTEKTVTQRLARASGLTHGLLLRAASS
jgi:hypothetical protein